MLKRNLLIAAGFLLVLGAGIGVGALLPRTMGGSTPAQPKNMDGLLPLAESAVKGTPLGAPLNAPPATAAPTPGAAPAVSIQADASAEQERLAKMIPQASWDLVKQAEQTSTGDLYKFDRTADGQFLKLTFAALGNFHYELPDPEAIRKSATPDKPIRQQIPEPLRKINGEKVILVGFMVPFDIDRKGNVKSFALTQNQAFCCFGIPPGMNEMVMVTMVDGKTAPFLNNIPIAVYGTVEVGEQFDDGYVVSLYRMKASEVIDVKELLRRAKESAAKN